MDFALEHRGPDDHDIWIDGEAGVVLVTAAGVLNDILAITIQERRR